MAYTGSNGGGKTACAVYDCLPTLAGVRWECRNIGHRHCHDVGCKFTPDRLAGCTCQLAPSLASLSEWDPPEDDGEYLAWLSTWEGDAGRMSHYEGPIPGATSGWRTVWSTTPLLDASGDRPRPHRRYRPLRSLRDLIRAEHGRVLLDEVQGIADARDHQSMPAGLRKRIYELRRADVQLGWTAVDYSAADGRMRQVTQAVVYARGFDPVATADGKWKPKTRFRWSTFDAADFDQFTAGKRQELAPLASQHVWRPGHLMERSYDTLAPVLSLSMASDSGTCTSCGGRKQRDPCGCEPDPSALPPGVEVVVDDKGRRSRRMVPIGAASVEGAPLPGAPVAVSARTERSEASTARTGTVPDGQQDAHEAVPRTLAAVAPPG